MILDVINQKGQHAILYGERGVGKTSLANVLSSFWGLANRIVATRINCDATDDYNSAWRKVFDQIALTSEQPGLGFTREPRFKVASAADLLGPSPATPASVRSALTKLATQALPILIIDEFDRLGQEPRRAFADTIKTLSDSAVNATIILVGVADSVEQLIHEHQSVERALVQIRMPRMSKAEIGAIIANGAARLKMSFSSVAGGRIAKLSQGLPHYTHLLALHACRAALDKQSMTVDTDAVKTAINKAISGAQQSIRTAYEYAVRSPRKDNLFSDVLLACAMAETNELGYFAAQDVRPPLQDITGRRYEIPSFAQHLNEFCDSKRGPILHKDGTRRLFRYRFINPLLQPFVVMRGVDADRIKESALD